MTKKKRNEEILDGLSECQLKIKDNIYSLVHVLPHFKGKERKKINEVLIQLADADNELRDMMGNYIEDPLLPY